jgi:hypothetical protein
MKSKILLIILAFGLCYCTSPKYITKKQSEIIKLDLDNSVTNYIPISDNDLKESKILDSSYCLIESKRYSKLDRYIDFLEASGISSSDMYLSKTLLLITKKDYANAAKSIEKINDSDYLLLKRLLSIDLNYEITKTNGGFDYNSFLKCYQDIIDSFPDDSSLNKIVAIRLRYLRYNY